MFLHRGVRKVGSPLLARTRTVNRPVGPIAYDCVKIITVRDGSAILFSEFGQKLVNVGDVVILGANRPMFQRTRGHISVTTIYLDTDYVVDQVCWQHIDLLQDRLDAPGFADTIYSDPAQVLRLGEDLTGLMMPWLDELVSLSMEMVHSGRGQMISVVGMLTAATFLGEALTVWHIAGGLLIVGAIMLCLRLARKRFTTRTARTARNPVASSSSSGAVEAPVFACAAWHR